MDPSSSSRIHSGGEGEKLSPLLAMLKARQEAKDRPN
jgi:hypothetical protein